MKVIAFSDGAYSPSTGFGSYGFVIYDRNMVMLTSGGKSIGKGFTNNVAEYRGAIAAVSAGISLGATDILLNTDSLLIVNQFTNQWKTKKKHLQPLLSALRSVASEADRFTIAWIPREQNQVADTLAAEAMPR